MSIGNVFDDQKPHWEKSFLNRSDMFGTESSIAAQLAMKILEGKNAKHILELGAGQGRDTFFFAQHGIHVTALDYTRTGIDEIQRKAEILGLQDHVTLVHHDARQPLPLADESFDGCYSHMLYCMAFRTSELHFLSQQIRRVLKPGGLNIYTVRHKGDSHFRQGVHHGEDMYEVGGFIVHFFDRTKVQQLAVGYDLLNIHEFEEGGLPRRLFQVSMAKTEDNP